MRRVRLLVTIFGAAVSLAAAAAPAAAIIAFNSNRCHEGNCATRIWVMEDDGSNLHPITDGGPPSGNDGQRLGNESDTSPTWSPAATHVAFTRHGGYGGRASLYIAARDGSAVGRVSQPDDPQVPVQDVWPDWSPLGALIAFESDRAVGDSATRARRIWVTSPDGSLARPLTDGRQWAHLPRFTPDGLRVVYIEYGFEPNGIRLMSVPVTGGVSLPVVAGDLPVGPFALAMAPDMRTLAVSANGPGGPGMYLLDALTGSLKQVGEPMMAGASWSYVGPALISDLVTGPRTAQIVRIDLGRPGSPIQRLTDGATFDGFPDWGGPDVLGPIRDLLPPALVVVPPGVPANGARAAHVRHGSAHGRLRVSAVDVSGVRSLHAAVARRVGRTCRFLVRGRLAGPSRCSRVRWFAAASPTAWRRATKRLPAARYRAWFKTRDGAGNVARRSRTLRLP